MDTKNYEKLAKQLGMHYSTASARLDRMVLFMLVQKQGLDVCYQCGSRIRRYQDMSTEHKQPWLDVDPTLFWDLENIAFSHKSCNSAAARKRHDKAKDAPAGTAWCAGHKEYLSVGQFDLNRTRASGYASYCKICRDVRG